MLFQIGGADERRPLLTRGRSRRMNVVDESRYSGPLKAVQMPRGQKINVYAVVEVIMYASLAFAAICLGVLLLVIALVLR
jgi:hypothetical protein